MTVRLYRDERPLAFFGIFALAFAAVGLVLGGGVVLEFMETHLVRRFPTAILATGLMLLAFLSLGVRPDPAQRRARPARDEAPGVSRA